MNTYDVIVIGTRAAGSPTAMLLARKGYRVLAVDRATFPSDTLSTHVIHAPGVAALSRWGILDQVASSGCPPISRYSFDFGPVTIAGRPRPVGAIDVAFAPRRTVLDALLVEAARSAGVEVRESYNVDELIRGSDGTVEGIVSAGRKDFATVVVGADGRNSRVARAVHADEYHTVPRAQYGYYTYFANLATDGMETFIRPNRGWGCAPTNDGLTMVVMGWPYAEATAFKADLTANFYKTFELVPEFADRVAQAEQVAPLVGGSVPGWFRKPYGDGWLLVGDAGYNKDPITAQGISDAFLDAERCTDAIDMWMGEGKPYDDVMSAWQQTRDAKATPIYEFTSQLAALEPPPPELQALFGAMRGNQAAMDDFVSVVAGTVSPADFFSEANVVQIMSQANADVAAGRVLLS